MAKKHTTFTYRGGGVLVCYVIIEITSNVYQMSKAFAIFFSTLKFRSIFRHFVEGFFFGTTLQLLDGLQSKLNHYSTTTESTTSFGL